MKNYINKTIELIRELWKVYVELMGVSELTIFGKMIFNIVMFPIFEIFTILLILFSPILYLMFKKK